MNNSTVQRRNMGETLVITLLLVRTWWREAKTNKAEVIVKLRH